VNQREEGKKKKEERAEGENALTLWRDERKCGRRYFHQVVIFTF